MNSTKTENGTLEVEVGCRWCGQKSRLRMTELELLEYKMGKAKIQDIFPHFSADDRELLVSGTCGMCWARMFANPD